MIIEKELNSDNLKSVMTEIFEHAGSQFHFLYVDIFGSLLVSDQSQDPLRYQKISNLSGFEDFDGYGKYSNEEMADSLIDGDCIIDKAVPSRIDFDENELDIDLTLTLTMPGKS